MDCIKDDCNYRWGEFSMKIAGRVGYQCSNYYRMLIQKSVILGKMARDLLGNSKKLSVVKGQQKNGNGRNPNTDTIKLLQKSSDV